MTLSLIRFSFVVSNKLYFKLHHRRSSLKLPPEVMFLLKFIAFSTKFKRHAAFELESKCRLCCFFTKICVLKFNFLFTESIMYVNVFDTLIQFFSASQFCFFCLYFIKFFLFKVFKIY